MSAKVRWTLAMVFVVGSAIVATLLLDSTRDATDVERVVRKYKAALGGLERAMNVTTREIEGTFEYKGVQQYGTGQLVMRWRAPKSVVEQLHGPMGTITRGFDGARAWGSHPQAGVRQLSSFEIDEIILEGALYQPLGVIYRYSEPIYEGRTTVRGRETEVLSATRRDGKTDRFYFDAITGLPIRLDVWEEGPEAVRTGRSGDFYLAHYTGRPLFPPAAAVANINLEAGNVWGRTSDVVDVAMA